MFSSTGEGRPRANSLNDDIRVGRPRSTSVVVTGRSSSTPRVFGEHRTYGNALSSVSLATAMLRLTLMSILLDLRFELLGLDGILPDVVDSDDDEESPTDYHQPH